jgi:hypothetical protein
MEIGTAVLAGAEGSAGVGSLTAGRMTLSKRTNQYDRRVEECDV